MLPVLSDDYLRHALRLWAIGYDTDDIAKILQQPEAAVANSIARFHGPTQGEAAWR